jgi:LytR cell envelope-related transcriptional attenuator
LTATAAGRGRGVGDNVLRNAARGAALIGVAVVIGIVLLQVVDKGSPGGSGGSTPTVATNPNNGGSSTTQGGDVHPPQEVRLLVLNGSGVAMAAATEANKLRGLGYAIAGTGNAATQAGATVQCRTGFDKEAAALAKAVGGGAAVSAFPDVPPAGAENADCLVTIGSG